MQVTPKLKPHNTHTKGIDLSVRITMSVQKEKKGVLFIFLPLKKGGGEGGLIRDGGLNRGYTVFFSACNYILHPTRNSNFPMSMPIPFVWESPSSVTTSHISLPFRLIMPLESLFLFFLWLFRKGPLGVVAWTLSFIVVCHTQQRESKKLDWK